MLLQAGSHGQFSPAGANYSRLRPGEALALPRVARYSLPDCAPFCGPWNPSGSPLDAPATTLPRILPFLIFLAVALLLVGGLHYYAWARLARDPQLPPAYSRALGTALAVLATSMLVGLFLSRRGGESLRPLYFGAFLWMGVGLLLVGLLGMTDLGRLLAAAVLRTSQFFTGAEARPDDPERRLLLSRALAATVGAAAVGLTALGVRGAMGAIDVKEVAVKLPRLPEALRGLRLVQISDVHIGPLLKRAWLEAVVARVQSLKPDIVAITGDLVDGTVAELAWHVAPLGSLSAPKGVYFVTGNHDHYSGAREWVQHVKTLGIQPLREQRVQLAPGLELAGVDDWSSGARDGKDIDRALSGRDPASALVLLAHQPRHYLEARNKDVQLTLSGHTHGGQIWPFSWFVHLAQPFVSGLHRHGDTQLYVSRGTGFWGPPMRVGAPAEITLLKLEPA